MLRKVSLLLLSGCGCLMADVNDDDYQCKEEYNNDEWLNLAVTNHLRKAGIDADLCFCGNLDFTSTFISQKENESKSGSVFSAQGNVDLRYLQRVDGYGFGAELLAKTRSGVIKHGRAIMNSAFLFLEADKIGVVRFGYINTAADALGLGGDKVLAGYGGAGSAELEAFYNASTGSIIGTGFTFDDDKAAKISWISPVISGFSGGLSYTFSSRNSNLFKKEHDPEEEGRNPKEDFAHETAYSKNVVTGGIAYEYGSPDGWHAKIALTGWLGSGQSNCVGVEVENVRAYNIGAILKYKNSEFAVGYTDNGKSLLAKKYAIRDAGAFNPAREYRINDDDVGLGAGANAGKIYTLGFAQTFGKFVASVGYFHSVVKFSGSAKSTANIITVASEYKFNKTFCVYAEYDSINTYTCDAALSYAKACGGESPTKDNRANVFMVGMKVNF